jgi:hypothetical protein
MNRRLSLLVLAGVVAALFVGCADTRASSVIVATAGGTVSVDSTQIVIPPNSLVADTEVAIMVGGVGELPALDGLRTVVRLEPEGTLLETSASVVVSGDTIGATDGQVVGAWQIVDGVWAPREHAVEPATGDVTVPVSFFSPVGITVRDAPLGGTIEGTLAWGTGDLVASAPVQLYLGDTLVAETTTGAAGEFSFTGLESGTYRVHIEYECTIDENVGVAAGMTQTLALVLCGAG